MQRTELQLLLQGTFTFKHRQTPFFYLHAHCKPLLCFCCFWVRAANKTRGSIQISTSGRTQYRHRRQHLMTLTSPSVANVDPSRSVNKYELERDLCRMSVEIFWFSPYLQFNADTYLNAHNLYIHIYIHLQLFLLCSPIQNHIYLLLWGCFCSIQHRGVRICILGLGLLCTPIH